MLLSTLFRFTFFINMENFLIKRLKDRRLAVFFTKLLS